MSSLANRLVVVFFKMVNLQTTDRDWSGRVERLVFHRMVYSVKRPITFSALGLSKQAVEYVTLCYSPTYIFERRCSDRLEGQSIVLILPKWNRVSDHMVRAFLRSV